MGLKNIMPTLSARWLTVYALAIIAGVLIGCTVLKGVTKKDVGPADRNAVNQTWYFDCCDPGLDEGTKDLCRMAGRDADHVLWDTDGNRYVFVWSECQVGKEPWRKYE